MHRPNFLKRLLLVCLLLLGMVVFGYPLAFTAVHGLWPSGWPRGFVNPMQWFAMADFSTILRWGATYIDMAMRRHPGLPGGGWPAGAALVSVTALTAVMIWMGGALEPRRHPSAREGNARFANRRELAELKRGLELGRDPSTQIPVRLEVEGNLVSIAPPRTGKTIGLILPNLAVPDENAWFGPAVVIDPKGDVYSAAKRRREDLGQTVRCIDPLGIAGGGDRWNPLNRFDIDDVIGLQSLVHDFQTEADTTSEAGEFFRRSAATIITAALWLTLRRPDRDFRYAVNLVRNPEKLRKAMDGFKTPIIDAAKAILDEPDDRTRGNILQTALAALDWCLDERLANAVAEPTFDMSDMSRGDVDLFIVLPADNRRKVMAPFVRLLLADLFGVVRLHPPAKRIIAFIDEAPVLGRFDAVLRGVGELPGYGISLWTIWQTQSQIEEIYGEAGARTITGTAEALTLFNVTAANEDELEKISRRLGTFTGIHETKSQATSSAGASTTETPVAQRLVPASDLPELTRRHTLVFLNSSTCATHPLKLLKTLALRDARFKTLLDWREPVRPLGG